MSRLRRQGALRGEARRAQAVPMRRLSQTNVSARGDDFIPCFRHALLAINRSALPRRRRQASIRSDLASIIEVPEQAFRPEDGGELWSD